MDNNQTKGSFDDELPIGVVRGEAKPPRSKRKKVILSLASVLLVFGLGGATYLTLSDKQKGETFDNQTTQNQQTTGSIQDQTNETPLTPAEPVKQKSDIPAGYKEYDDPDNKLSLNYPDSWKDSKPKITPIQKYKIELMFGPILKYSIEDNGWIVADSGGIDEYPKGTYYEAKVIRKDRDLTVYDFGMGDGGCEQARIVFIADSKVIEIQSSQVCHGDNGDTKPLDKLQEETKEVAFSIKFD